MNPGESIVMLSGLAAVVAGALYAGTPTAGRVRAANTAFGIHAALLVGGLVLLAGCFLAHRFEYTYVASYSSRALTPALTFAALWAGQEGSFLLWAAIGALVGVALMFQPGRLTRPAMALVSVTQLALVLLLIARTPFARVALGPADGQGLNPLLEDPWMVAHPPALFVGYAAMMVPFALAAAALMLGDYREWNRMVWPWALFAVVSLGAGIIMGGIWAYRTLGWGGFWGWDPVENASLVPWLVAVALLHGLLIQRTLGTLPRTNLLLALLGWVTTVGGTYLTRSGVLSNFSVHAFADSGLHTPLLLFLAGTSLLCAGLLAWRWTSFATTSSNWLGVSRESALWLGLMTVLGFALLVAIGTIAPILTSLSGKPGSVQPSYYNTLAVPIGLLALVLMALAPALRWVRQQGIHWLSLMPPGLVAGGLVLAATLPMGLRDPVYVALVFLTGCAIGINAWMAARLFKRGWMFGAGYAGHVGVALMALGIAVSTSAGRTERLTLQAGQSVESLGMKVSFRGRQTDPRGAQYLDMHVEGRGLSFNARPRLMDSPRGDGLIRTPAIHGWRELYLSPVDLKAGAPETSEPVALERGRTIEADQARGAPQLPRVSAALPIAIVDFSTKPLVNLVWVGALIMLLGTSLAGLRRAGEQRPAPGPAHAEPAAAAAG